MVLSTSASAGPAVIVEAVVSDDLASVRGTLEVERPHLHRLVDPLAALPAPSDDRTLLRTFPGVVERGVVRFDPIAPGVWRFHTVLPRRYGDVGALPRRGLFANGYWYPQLVGDDGVPVVDWSVRVELPEGTTGALGEVVGQRELRWSGRSERASLAVVRRGRITPVVAGDVALQVLTRGRPREVMVDRIAEVVSRGQPEGARWTGVVVEAPLRRRLARAGAGLAYVSDRAWRVSPGTRRFHDAAVTRQVVESVLGVDDPLARDLAAAAIARHLSQQRADARGVLAWAAWMPRIDALLHDRTMPFAGDVLEEVHPTDPLRDDLLEVLDPHTDGAVVSAQLDADSGPGTSWSVARALAAGATAPQAAAEAGIAPARLEAWRRAYPVQDYQLEVSRDPTLAMVVRLAPADAPAEVVLLDVDGVPTPIRFGPGPGRRGLELAPSTRRVVLDPERHLGQTSRVGDSWPARYTTTMAAWVSAIHISQVVVEGAAALWLRRRYDTHNTWSGTLYTDEENLVGAIVGYARKEGPLVDGLTRAHRLSVWLSPALLAPRFAPVEGGRVALEGGLGWEWDARVSEFFPLRGHSIRLSTDAGLVPGSERTWAAARARAVGVLSPHPRHALAGRAIAGVAKGDVDHRLLALGGSAALRSLPPGTAIGTKRVGAMMEYRWAPIRNASVPALVVWGTDLFLTAGAEVGAVWIDGQRVAAAGVTGGVGIVGEWLGYEPSMVGLTLGKPVWAHTSQVDGPIHAEDLAQGAPQLTLRWGQAF